MDKLTFMIKGGALKETGTILVEIDKNGLKERSLVGSLEDAGNNSLKYTHFSNIIEASHKKSDIERKIDELSEAYLKKGDEIIFSYQGEKRGKFTVELVS